MKYLLRDSKVHILCKSSAFVYKLWRLKMLTCIEIIVHHYYNNMKNILTHILIPISASPLLWRKSMTSRRLMWHKTSALVDSFLKEAFKNYYRDNSVFTNCLYRSSQCSFSQCHAHQIYHLLTRTKSPVKIHSSFKYALL